MNKGIVIVALNKPAYTYGAYNLALSIKHYNPNINITLLTDGTHAKHLNVSQLSVFDWIKEMLEHDYTDDRFQPALAKFNFHKYSGYEHTLYIDADSICLKDIGPLLETLSKGDSYICSNAMGKGGRDEKIDYSPWATNEQMWNYFGLKEDSKVITINSSWIYVRKGAESHKFFERLLVNYNKGFGIENLLHQWGGTYPDELFYNGTLAQMDIDPTIENNVMFFGNKHDNLPVSRLHDEFYFFTLFGNGAANQVSTVRLKFIEFYDRLLFMMCQQRGHEHLYKAHYLLQGKHFNNK